MAKLTISMWSVFLSYWSLILNMNLFKWTQKNKHTSRKCELSCKIKENQEYTLACGIEDQGVKFSNNGIDCPKHGIKT